MIASRWLSLFPILIYLMFVLPSILHNRLYVTGDNLIYHYPVFGYMVNSLRFGHGIPDWLPPKLTESPVWFPSEGGVPIDLLTVNFFPLLPHKVVGYALAMLPGVNVIVAYKLSILCGIAIIAVGWWLFLERIFGNTLASVGTSFLLFSGIGFTPFHQEQALATVEYVPWLLYSVSRVVDHPLWLLAAGFLTGEILAQHYPPIHVLVGIAFLASLASGGVWKKALRVFRTNPPLFLLLGGLLFLVGMLPVLRILQLQGDFASPLRSVLSVKTLEDYLRLNEEQVSSAPVSYLLHLLIPFYRVGWIGGRLGQWGDQFGFAIFPVCTALAIGGVIAFKTPRRFLILLALLLLFCVGTNGFVPQLLFVLHVPFIEHFRQWYHFHPYVLMCLSYMAVVFLSSLDPEKMAGIRDARGAPILRTDLRAGVSILLLLVTPIYGVLFFQSYVNHAFSKSEKFLSNEAKERDLKGRYEILYETLPMPEAEKPTRPPLFVSKEYMQLEKLCGLPTGQWVGMSGMGRQLQPYFAIQGEVEDLKALCALDHGIRTITTPHGLILTVEGVERFEQDGSVIIPYPRVFGLKLKDDGGGCLVERNKIMQAIELSSPGCVAWPSTLELEVTGSYYPVFGVVWFVLGAVLIGMCFIWGKSSSTMARVGTAHPSVESSG